TLDPSNHLNIPSCLISFFIKIPNGFYRVLTNSMAMKEKSLTALQATDLIAKTYKSGIFDIVYPDSSTNEF
ncbi:MAG TPA: hypothetical protein ACFCUY_17480, partial [Xenococcaceae cyanobacterium]